MGTKIASRLLLVVLAAAALAGGGAHTAPGRTPAIVADRARVFGADAEQSDWFAGRSAATSTQAWTSRRSTFTSTPTPPGATGTSAHSSASRVDICVVIVSEMARDTVLHEMGHAWVDENVSATVRERFLRMRGLTAWNDQIVIWDERGFEHAAEIMAWALGNRFIAPGIPDHDPDQLDRRRSSS